MTAVQAPNGWLRSRIWLLGMACFFSFGLASGSASAQAPLTSSGGGAYTPPADELSPMQRTALFSAADASANRLGVKRLQGIAPLSEVGSTTTLAWPVRPGSGNNRDRQAGVSNYVDVNPSFPNAVQDYMCGDRSYDTTSGYNHQGIDISSWPYPWTTMDADGLDIVAAASGTIILRRDNEPDRSCSLNPNADWNVVIVEHADGTRAMYGHMKTGSLTAKVVGDTVVAGEYLGQVGSSGNSTGPHLHFELVDAQNNHIDPYAGQCGNSESRWQAQPPYNAPRVHAVITGNGEPQLGQCDGSEVSHETSQFDVGESVYVTAFFTNQLQGVSGSLTLYQPNGEIWLETQLGPAPQDYPFSYFWRAFAAPDLPGRWRAVVSLGTEVSETEFFIGTEAPAPGVVVAALLPSSRSVQIGATASFFATMANAGGQDLNGCRIVPVVPLDADFSFQTTDPLTNAVNGGVNESATIPVGAAQSFVVALTPHSAAQPMDLEFAFRCNNADRAFVIRGLNTLQFSATAQSVADILPVAATTSNDGVVRLGGTNGSAAFATAAVNIGAAANALQLVPVLAAGGADLSVCETDAGGQCLAAPTPTMSVDFDGTPRTFTVFVFATGTPLPLDPANTRIVLRFEQDGVTRGSTSVAVTTDG